MSDSLKAIVLVGHGGLPKDCPREIIQQFKQMERDRKASGRPASARERELEQQIREWPRTPQNDPYKAGLESIAEKLRPLLPGIPLVLAYNEFCAPSVADAVAGLAEAGTRSITVAPTMLTPGGSHSEIEIPEILAGLRGRYPEVDLRYAWPADLDLLARMFAEHLRSFEK